MKRRAFTLTEIVVSIVILGIMAASLTLSSSSSNQTAKMEAERIATMMNRLIETADRMNSTFWFMIKTNGFYIFNGKEYKSGEEKKLDFKISAGCKCSAVDDYKNMCYLADDLNKAPQGMYRKISKRNVSITIETAPKTGTRIFNILVTAQGTSAYVVISQNES